jgi:hypothetical protein
MAPNAGSIQTFALALSLAALFVPRLWEPSK